MFFEVGNQEEALLERDLQYYASDTGANETGTLVLFCVLGLAYLGAAIYGFMQLSKKDAELPVERRVFGTCCMTGYILVCCFTPVCFLVIYFFVTMGMINDNRQTIVSPYNNYNNQQKPPVAGGEAAPVAVAAQPVYYAEQKGSPAIIEEQV